MAFGSLPVVMKEVAAEEGLEDVDLQVVSLASSRARSWNPWELNSGKFEHSSCQERQHGAYRNIRYSLSGTLVHSLFPFGDSKSHRGH